jgi:hypothetical protein
VDGAARYQVLLVVYECPLDFAFLVIQVTVYQNLGLRYTRCCCGRIGWQVAVVVVVRPLVVEIPIVGWARIPVGGLNPIWHYRPLS